MNRIWKFTPWFPYEIGIANFVGSCVVRFEPSNLAARASLGEFKDGFPEVQLDLKLENCSVDCFQWESCIFVSERMRRTMTLEPNSIQYFDIDASGSAPLPRSMNYKIMNIPVTADIADPTTSRYLSPEIYPGGPIGAILRFPQHIAIRSDAKADHDLFHDQFFGEPFCSDELALRVLQAACTGVRFIDPAHMVGDRIAFRTLRGVEEEVNWNAKRKVLQTKLVEVSTNTESGPQWSSVTEAPREQRIG
jgi:hypothetical protein